MVGVLSCTVCGGQQVVEEPRALRAAAARFSRRSEEHTSELQSRSDLVCRLLLEKKKKRKLDNRDKLYNNIRKKRTSILLRAREESENRDDNRIDVDYEIMCCTDVGGEDLRVWSG